MGADLYIKPEFDEVYNKYNPKFEEAVEKRDKAKSEEERDKWQEKVELYFRKMTWDNPFYFRDSYNPSNLLWKLSLSWWALLDMGIISKKGVITPKSAKKLLEMVKKSWEERKERLKAELGEDFEYFEEKYEKLVKFLTYAIEKKRKIIASV